MPSWGFWLSFWYQGHVREAYLFLIGAAIFDKLDGAMARKLGLTELLAGNVKPPRFQLAGILDDISDGISFCIVPAWIYYRAVLLYVPAISDLTVFWIALIYALMGIVRLIYFTLDTSPIPGFFKGNTHTGGGASGDCSPDHVQPGRESGHHSLLRAITLLPPWFWRQRR